jgi:hypothetical protein
MTSLKRTVFGTTTAARTEALTASWKKAFDARIREAALTRNVPARRPGKLGLPALATIRRDRDPRS